MYIGNVLLENGFAIESYDQGPDFIVDKEIYLECVSPTHGDSANPNSLPRINNDGEWHQYPEREIILRITSVFKEKTDKYVKWRNRDRICATRPYIIAISTSWLQYPEALNMPNVLKALFGVSCLKIPLDGGDKFYEGRESIQKNDTTESTPSHVPVNYFCSPDVAYISGVLFSNEIGVTFPTPLGSDCFLVKNPYARNAVPDIFASKFNEFTVRPTKNKIIFTLNSAAR